MSNNRYAKVPVACNNRDCLDAKECLRYEAWEAKAKKRVKRFNGSPEKGCGKFIPKLGQ